MYLKFHSLLSQGANFYTYRFACQISMKRGISIKETPPEHRIKGRPWKAGDLRTHSGSEDGNTQTRLHTHAHRFKVNMDHVRFGAREFHL